MEKEVVYPFIGSHQSISGMTVPERLKDSYEISGRRVVQMFNGSKYKFERKGMSQTEIEECLKFTRSQLVRGFAHGAYCFNLARPIETDSKHLMCLFDDLKVLGPAGMSTVAHVGSGVGEYTMSDVCRNLQHLKFNGPNRTMPLLLENSAGQGTSLGVSIEEMSFLAQNTDPHIGFCIDTQHAFVGMKPDLQSVDGVNEFLKSIDRAVGLDRVGLFHLNDSMAKKDSAGKKDYHAYIGEGYIWGMDVKHQVGLKHLLLRGGELGIPFITETTREEEPEIVYSFLNRVCK